MTPVIDISQGKVYYAYPVEFNGELELFKTPLYKEVFALFRIMDAVYTYEKKFKIGVMPYNIGGTIVWKYRITSPLIRQKIYIQSENKHLTSTMPMDEYHLSDHKYRDEYQIDYGNLYTLRTSGGVMAYLCRLFTEPAKEKYLINNEHKYFDQENTRRTKLLEIADDIAPHR